MNPLGGIRANIFEGADKRFHGSLMLAANEPCPPIAVGHFMQNTGGVNHGRYWCALSGDTRREVEKDLADLLGRILAWRLIRKNWLNAKAQPNEEIRF